MSSTDAHRAESVSAQYASLGRGKYHLLALGESQTVCGREVEFPVPTTIYKPSVCARCAKAAPELLEAAEAARKALWEQADEARQDRLTKHRAGCFTVYRCRTCGAQHRNPDAALGTPFCLAAGHVADIEEVEAVGPRWGETP